MSQFMLGNLNKQMMKSDIAGKHNSNSGRRYFPFCDMFSLNKQRGEMEESGEGSLLVGDEAAEEPSFHLK